MLLLVFQLGSSRFAIDALDVNEITPYVNLKDIPRAPEYVAGMFDYRGALLPVVDLSVLAFGKESRHCMTTRIMVVTYKPADGPPRSIGLVAEKVTETIHADPEHFEAAGVVIPEAPYLGDIARDNSGLVQLIRIDQLLPDSVYTSLFEPSAA